MSDYLPGFIIAFSVCGFVVGLALGISALIDKQQNRCLAAITKQDLTKTYYCYNGEMKKK